MFVVVMVVGGDPVDEDGARWQLPSWLLAVAWWYTRSKKRLDRTLARLWLDATVGS